MINDRAVQRVLAAVVALGAVTVACLLFDVSRLADGSVRLDILDAGQGDSLLLTTPQGLRVLIDGGTDGRALRSLGWRLPAADQRVDMIVLTHPHRDHLVGLPALVRRGGVRWALLGGTPSGTYEYAAFLESLAQAGTTVIPADPMTMIDLGDNLSLDVLWPPAESYGQPWSGDINDASVTLALRWYGQCLALLTGDLEAVGEATVLQSGANIACELLKAGHHGSKTSSGVDWLLAARPKVAALSAGIGNTYGHPSPEILERLDAAGIAIRRTDEEGTLSFRWETVR